MNSLAKGIITIGCFALMGTTLNSCRRTRTPEPDGPGVITPNTITWCGHIEEPTVWSNHSDGVDYIITCPVIVREDFTIEPGTEIVFEQGASIYVQSNAIMAKGTATAPIRFRGKNDVQGAWNTIGVSSNDPRNEFDHCIFENGGAGGISGTVGWEPANLMIRSSAKISVSNCTFAKSSNYGLYVDRATSAPNQPFLKYENNTFINNKENPISVSAPNVGAISGTDHTYTDNGKQLIHVRGENIRNDMVWKNAAIPYHITGDIGWWNGNLDVEAGVQMLFNLNTGFVDEYSTSSNSGHLRFNGTESQPIRLASFDPTAHWDGMLMRTRHPSSVMNWVIVDRAGGKHFIGATQPAAIATTSHNPQFKLIMNNCTISNSAGYGIAGNNNTPLPTLNNITYINNALGNTYP